VSVQGFGGSGLRTKGTGRYRTPGLQVSNSTFSYNWAGIYSEDNNAEYTLFDSTDCSFNRIGVRAASGNMSFVNMKVSDNGYGVWLYGTGIINNGHGNFSNSLINHSSVYSIYTEGVSNGFVFAGNNIHVGSIYLKASSGIAIQSGEINPQHIYLEGGGRNLIQNNVLNSESDALVVHNYNGSADDTLVRDNYSKLGRVLDGGFSVTNDPQTIGGVAGFFEPFTGTTINPRNWMVTGTLTQNGTLTGTGTSSWGTTGVTSTRFWERSGTLTLAADVKADADSNYFVFGFASRSALGYTTMPHAILWHPTVPRFYIYENGTSRGAVGPNPISSANTYRLKIVTNATGAVYYYSTDAGATWSTLYDGTANNITTSPLYVRWAVNIGTAPTLDNVSVSTGFSANGAVPQAAYAVGAAAPAGGTGAAAGGWSSAVDRDAAIVLINNMRDALIKAGLLIP
jgi:hypothetical protein